MGSRRRSGDVDSQTLEFILGLGLYLVVFGDAEEVADVDVDLWAARAIEQQFRVSIMSGRSNGLMYWSGREDIPISRTINLPPLEPLNGRRALESCGDIRVLDAAEVLNGYAVICCFDSSKGRLERLVADLWRGHRAGWCFTAFSMCRTDVLV
jgi:hypothetical protein